MCADILSDESANISINVRHVFESCIQLAIYVGILVLKCKEVVVMADAAKASERRGMADVASSPFLPHLVQVRNSFMSEPVSCYADIAADDTRPVFNVGNDDLL